MTTAQNSVHCIRTTPHMSTQPHMIHGEHSRTCIMRTKDKIAYTPCTVCPSSYAHDSVKVKGHSLKQRMSAQLNKRFHFKISRCSETEKWLWSVVEAAQLKGLQSQQSSFSRTCSVTKCGRIQIMIFHLWSKWRKRKTAFVLGHPPLQRQRWQALRLQLPTCQRLLNLHRCPVHAESEVLPMSHWPSSVPPQGSLAVACNGQWNHRHNCVEAMPTTTATPTESMQFDVNFFKLPSSTTLRLFSQSCSIENWLVTKKRWRVNLCKSTQSVAVCRSANGRQHQLQEWCTSNCVW